MADRDGTRYVRHYRKLDPADPQSTPGTRYSRIHPDDSSEQVWWPDSLASFNPTGRTLPRWVRTHLDADDWDGGN